MVILEGMEIYSFEKVKGKSKSLSTISTDAHSQGWEVHGHHRKKGFANPSIVLNETKCCGK